METVLELLYYCRRDFFFRELVHNIIDWMPIVFYLISPKIF